MRTLELSYWRLEGLDRLGILGLTINLSLPFTPFPPGWSFVSVWFVFTLKFFNLCPLTVPFLLVLVAGPVLTVQMVGMKALRV